MTPARSWETIIPESVAALLDKLWIPSTCLYPEAIAFPRHKGWTPNATLALAASGTLQLSGGLLLRPGVPITSINFVSGTTAGVTLSNQWFCLVDQNLNVLAKTVDDGATAWGASVQKTLAIAGGPYTPGSYIAAYVGLVVVAVTLPTVRGTGQHALTPDALSPILAATSTAGLTNPASLGPVAGALTAVASLPLAWLS